MNESQNKEMVNHPAHYGGEENPYEVIKVIEALGLGEGFCLGNAIKYIARHKDKGTPLQDLKKGRWYLNRWVTTLEEKYAKGAD
jgi:hypothetical protein